MGLENLDRIVYGLAYIAGDYHGASGQPLKGYYDTSQVVAFHAILTAVAEQMAELVPDDTEVMAGVPESGKPIAQEIAKVLDLPQALARETAKTHGLRSSISGVDIQGRTVCLVENVVTTGQSTVLWANRLREHGAIIKDVVALIERSDADARQTLTENGITLHTLYTQAQLETV